MTESNVIDEYLVDKYDKSGIFGVKGEQEEYSVKQWLGFQAASQGPFFAQVSRTVDSLAKRTR
jgi:glutathione S-transferase